MAKKIFSFPPGATIGERIKQLRTEKGISQGGLARKIENILNQSAISAVERGMLTPTPEQVEAIALALDVPVDSLFDRPMRIEDAEEEEPEQSESSGDDAKDEVEDIFSEEYKEIQSSLDTFLGQMEKILCVGKSDHLYVLNMQEKVSYFIDRMKETYEEVQEAIMEIDERTLYKKLLELSTIHMMLCEKLATRPNSRAYL